MRRRARSPSRLERLEASIETTPRKIRWSILGICVVLASSLAWALWVSHAPGAHFEEPHASDLAVLATARHAAVPGLGRLVEGMRETCRTRSFHVVLAPQYTVGGARVRSRAVHLCERGQTLVMPTLLERHLGESAAVRSVERYANLTATRTRAEVVRVGFFDPDRGLERVETFRGTDAMALQMTLDLFSGSWP